MNLKLFILVATTFGLVAREDDRSDIQVAQNSNTTRPQNSTTTAITTATIITSTSAIVKATATETSAEKVADTPPSSVPLVDSYTGASQTTSADSAGMDKGVEALLVIFGSIFGATLVVASAMFVINRRTKSSRVGPAGLFKYHDDFNPTRQMSISGPLKVKEKKDRSPSLIAIDDLLESYTPSITANSSPRSSKIDRRRLSVIVEEPSGSFASPSLDKLLAEAMEPLPHQAVNEHSFDDAINFYNRNSMFSEYPSETLDRLDEKHAQEGHPQLQQADNRVSILSDLSEWYEGYDEGKSSAQKFRISQELE